ncbi:Dethiobiotin synthetase [Minicystis rosea]|nr:Dethiobiotin synthetase [Minicystis rosea]
MRMSRIVVVGTGTGIGKTHLGISLLRALASAGVSVAGLKPIESGVGAGPTDAELLDRAGMFHVKHPPPYALAAPLSPHLAAAQEGVTIQLKTIQAWVASSEATWTLIESAGALLSPISPLLTNLDLTVALEPDQVVLVAPDRLGVLHDVTATLFAYRILAPRLPEPIVALQPPAEADSSTGSNAQQLLELGIARTVVSFLRAPLDAPENLARALELARLLGAVKSA